MPEEAVFIVHDLAQARAALAAAGRARVRIESAPGAAAYAGAAWFNALAAEAGAEFPRARAQWVLDCGAEAGAALGAIREGVAAIRTRAAPRARARIAAIARAAKVAVYTGRARGLDLATTDEPETAARAHLRAGRAQLKKAPPSAIPEAPEAPRRGAAGTRTKSKPNRRERNGP